MACVVFGWNVSKDSYWQGTQKYSSETCPSDTLSVSNSRETELLRWEASSSTPEIKKGQAAVQFQINVKQALNWTDTEIIKSLQEILQQNHNVKFCRNPLTSFGYHICVRVIGKAYRPDHHMCILLSSRNRCFDYDVSFRCMFKNLLILHTWSSKTWTFIATLNKCYIITDSSRAHWISSCLRENFWGTKVKSRRRPQRHKRRNFTQMCLLSDKNLECEGSTSVSTKFNFVNPSW